MLKAEVEKITPEAIHVHGVPDPGKEVDCVRWCCSCSDSGDDLVFQ